MTEREGGPDELDSIKNGGESTKKEKGYYRERKGRILRFFHDFDNESPINYQIKRP